MKRLHIHMNTHENKFDQAIGFYSTLFASAPSKTRPNYAKWMLDDPSVNFVVEVLEVDGDKPGIHHLGIQVDESEELDEIKNSLKAENAPLLEIGQTTCCFSKSEKNWTMDPSGIRWETFRSFGDVDDYGEKTLSEIQNYISTNSL